MPNPDPFVEELARASEIAEQLCEERCAQMGDPPCSRVTSDPHCDECQGMSLRVQAIIDARVAQAVEGAAKVCDDWRAVFEQTLDSQGPRPATIAAAHTAGQLAKEIRSKLNGGDRG